VIDVFLDDNKIDELKKLSRDQWLILLNDSISDWASSLCLYFLTDRDVDTMYFYISDRSLWYEYNLRDSDIVFWSNYFNNTTGSLFVEREPAEGYLPCIKK